jgi:hypothetical protein
MKFANYDEYHIDYISAWLFYSLSTKKPVLTMLEKVFHMVKIFHFRDKFSPLYFFPKNMLKIDYADKDPQRAARL